MLTHLVIEGWWGKGRAKEELEEREGVYLPRWATQPPVFHTHTLVHQAFTCGADSKDLFTFWTQTSRMPPWFSHTAFVPHYILIYHDFGVPGLDIGGPGNVLSRPEFQDQNRGQLDTLQVSRLRMTHKPGKTLTIWPLQRTYPELYTALSAQTEYSMWSWFRKAKLPESQEWPSPHSLLAQIPKKVTHFRKSMFVLNTRKWSKGKNI